MKDNNDSFVGIISMVMTMDHNTKAYSKNSMDHVDYQKTIKMSTIISKASSVKMITRE